MMVHSVRTPALLNLCLAAFLLALSGSPAMAQTSPIAVKVRGLPVGDQTVEVVIHQACQQPRWLMCNLHDDEDTSVEAGLSILARYPTRLVELKHSGQREIAFQIEDTTFRCDPNRIFTPMGVKATLQKLSTFRQDASEHVQSLGQALVDVYDVNNVHAVVALHNNLEGRYAASSYAAGQEYESEAAAVHLVAGGDPDDFFFVTDQTLFDRLSAANFNVVLQDNTAATDDGSLSVYCGRRGLVYVNVEAQHGHRQQQERMLVYLFETLTKMAKHDAEAEAKPSRTPGER